MADVIASHAQILAIFKELYGEKIAEQVNLEPFMMNMFDKSTRQLAGKHWTVPAHMEGLSTGGGPSAVGSYADDEEVADSGAEAYKELQIQPKQHYGTVQITGLAKAMSRTNLASFTEAWGSEVKEKLKWLISQLNAQTYQGGLGALGRVGSSSDTTHVTVASTALGNPDAPIPPMSWFRVGMKLDVWADGAPFVHATTKRNGTAGTKKEGVVVTGISGRILTLGTAVASMTANETNTGDWLIYEDGRENVPSGEQGKTLNGFALLVDDETEGPTTFQNISRTTYPIFRGNRMHNSYVERELSLDLLQQLLDTNRIQSGIESDFLVSGYGMRRKYLNLLWHDVRYAPQELKGGFKTLQFDSLDWYVDKDCPHGRVIAGRKEMVKKYVVRPLGILGDAGTQAERISKKDSYEILIGGYFNFGIERPNSWGKLVDLVDPAI